MSAVSTESAPTVDEPVEIEPDPKDLDEIVPTPGQPFEIGARSGKPVLVRVNRLKTRELLVLMRALGRGLGPTLADIDFEGDVDEMTGEFVGILVMAMAEAGPDLLAFLQMLVDPVGTSKDEKTRVAAEMANPEPEDTLSIIEQVALNEVGDLKALLGKAQAMWASVSKMYARTSNGG